MIVSACACRMPLSFLVLCERKFKSAQVMHGGQLLTVFSARNYLDLQSNDSALLLIAYDSDGRMRIRPKRLLHRGGRIDFGMSCAFVRSCTCSG